MCVVSNDIKFCTCEVGDYEELPHYWVLHRYNRSKKIQILGSLVMSEDYLLPNFELNKNTFQKRLNTHDAFDKEIAFKNNDVLEIVLNNKKENQRMTFCFKYKEGTWIETTYDYFKLVSRFDEEAFGVFSELKKYWC